MKEGLHPKYGATQVKCACGAVLETASTKDGKIKAECVVTVVEKFVAVNSVSIDKRTASVAIGDTVTLKATVNPNNATDKTVTWTSSDETIATVVDGIVTGLAEGQVTITAAVGEKTATSTVTVKTVKATGVKLDKTEIEMAVDGVVAITAVQAQGMK